MKGAAAAALYGARAANGVISITTRRGSQIPDGETRITFRSEFGKNGIEHYTEQAGSHWFKVDGSGNWMTTPTAAQYSYTDGTVTSYATPAAANPTPCP